MDYLHVFISAETPQQAATIMDALLAKKLVFGGPTWQGPAKFWWKGEICAMDYCFLFTYTRADFKQTLIEEAEKASAEEVCMISFTPLDANPALIRLLDTTFGNKP
ncbi:MAG: divalent cation tolerance protein CutA [Proteobacteria bacterium]|nr:divalent cation tolerance protein CutA [Pseudomonadota bacterium]